MSGTGSWFGTKMQQAAVEDGPDCMAMYAFLLHVLELSKYAESK
jgi:hypothetical protein